MNNHLPLKTGATARPWEIGKEYLTKREAIDKRCHKRTSGFMEMTDEQAMAVALEEAKCALKLDEVPVGAVVLDAEGRIVAQAHNLRETRTSPIAHAEIVALEQASQILGRWRLSDCTLFVTLEPCVMCAGALVNARLKRVVFGARDPKGGAVKSLYELCDDPRLNHRMEITEGILADDCGKILSDFFRAKRELKLVPKLESHDASQI